MNKDRLINLERLNQFKLNLVESKDNSLDITNEDQSKIDIKAKISEEEGNILTLKEDGLYVAPDGSLLSTDNSISIEVTDEGTDLTLKKSEEEDNAIVKKEDGVFVQKYDMATEDEVMALLGAIIIASTKLFFRDGSVKEPEEVKNKDSFTLQNSLDFPVVKDKLIKVILGKDITGIGSEAFSWCSFLTSITIPDGVTKIGYQAFYNCYNLTSIEIPNSVTSIGESAFYGCYNLTSITIPDGVTSIGNSVFSDCTSLQSIEIPDSVTSIGRSAFSSCSSLTSITIPNSVTEIGSRVFDGCSSNGTLRCNQEWFNNLSEENRTNLGNLANWTKEWID